MLLTISKESQMKDEWLSWWKDDAISQTTIKATYHYPTSCMAENYF